MRKQLSDQPTWEDIKREATALEITLDDSLGDVWMQKYNSVCGGFQDSLAGRRAAWEWLEQLRRAIAVRDQFRRSDPPRRRLLVRWLWRREGIDAAPHEDDLHHGRAASSVCSNPDCRSPRVEPVGL